jgi:hypothetical protein
VDIRQDAFENQSELILKNYGLLLIALLFVLMSQQTRAQEQDFGTWMNASVEYEAWKDLELSLGPELRWDENVTRLRNVQSDFGVQYKLKNDYSTGVVVRIGQVQRDSGWQGRRRIQFFVGKKWKIVKDLDVSFKTRVQFSSSQQTSTRDGDLNSNWRNKISVSYDGIKKTKFTAGYEFFHGIQRAEFLEWQDWRLSLDVERKINKRNFVSLGWIVQTEFTIPRVRRDNILVLSYKFVVPSKF